MAIPRQGFHIIDLEDWHNEDRYEKMMLSLPLWRYVKIILQENGAML